MTVPTTEVTTADGVTWIRFRRPERLNAFTVADYRDLRVALERAADDEDTGVVVLTGDGRAFSAGADRSLLDPSVPPDPDLDGGAEFDGLVDALAGCPVPLLAAVNGLAVGVGVTMLLHCDLVVAAASARFRMPFTALGVAPEAGSSVLLPARVRFDEAMWALFSSEWIEAADAREMGLVWRVVADDELADRVQGWAESIAANDPEAVRTAKRLLVAGRLDAVREASAAEVDAMRHLMSRHRPD